MNGESIEEMYRRASILGAATVHEAAGRIGALPSRIKPINRSWRIAGPAFPVLTPPSITMPPNLNSEAAVDMMSPQ